MLINSNDLLKKAYKDGYAIGAYNINNLEWAKYILEACNLDNAPVILAVTEKAISHMGSYKIVHSIIKSLIDELKIKVPVVLHLDHAKSIESCISAINSGFTSIMIDASDKPFDENVKITQEVVSYATKHNVSVEAELGSLGKSEMTNPDDALEFVLQTGINIFAPSVGNKHGLYTKKNVLNFELLGDICKKVKIPLVLHGASNLDDNKIKTAIFCGVSKININTDIQIAWSKEVRKFLKKNKKEYDPRKIISSGEVAIKKLIHRKNELFGSKNKAFK